jgi:hypothetical protein
MPFRTINLQPMSSIDQQFRIRRNAVKAVQDVFQSGGKTVKKLYCVRLSVKGKLTTAEPHISFVRIKKREFVTDELACVVESLFEAHASSRK